MTFRIHLLWLPVVGVMMSQCRPSVSPRPADEMGDQDPCTVQEISRESLKMETGEEVYVDGDVFHRNPAGDILLAGTPNHLWGRNARGRGVPLGSNQVVGVLMGADGRNRLVRPPPGVDGTRLEGIRAVDLDSTRWGWILPEMQLKAGTDQLDDRRLNVLWYAEHDGNDWTRVERLPVPEPYIDAVNGSTLLRRGDTLAYALHGGPDRRLGASVILWERPRSRWRREDIPITLATEVALAASDSLGLVMLVVRPAPDTITRSDGNSLFLYARTPNWAPLRRIVFGHYEGAVFYPVLSLAEKGVLTWQTGGANGMEGRAMIGITERTNGRSIVLDQGISWALVPLQLRNRHFWALNHVEMAQPPTNEIRILTVDSSSARQEIARFDNPYYGGDFSGVAIEPDTLLLSGVSVNMQDTLMVSMMIRARVLCATPPDP